MQLNMAINAPEKVPHILKTKDAGQLIVHGRPFLVRGAELQNSSFSSLDHMADIWPKMVDMHVNTVLGSISWETIEPEEGRFDFSIVDGIIGQARAHNLKLILLWFGTWKNGISTYIPSWVKMSPDRFPRVVIRTPEGIHQVTEILTPVYGSAVKADLRAFRALMAHLKSVDESQNTVIMVQVENEVGVLGDSRDRSYEANKIFNSPVPDDLIDLLTHGHNALHKDLKAMLKSRFKTLEALRRGRNWAEVFDDSKYTDQMFMAYHYALYVNEVATAGKEVYNLPMFANFWQNYGEDKMAEQYPTLAGGGKFPGDYPSGGAVSSVLDIWMRFAPALDFLSPDTYLNDYHRICATYRHKNQPLFIPEQRRDEYGARRIWAAIGAYQAIGACPFALDTLTVEECAYTKHYKLLAQVADVILQAQQDSRSIVGFFYDELESKDASTFPAPIVQMGGYEVEVQRAFTTGSAGPGYGVVIHLDTRPDRTARFLLVGAGFQVKFKSLDPNACYTGILKFEEQSVDNKTGKMAPRRTLNGDETRSGQQAIMPNDIPDDGGFPININIPAVTKIAECTVYELV